MTVVNECNIVVESKAVFKFFKAIRTIKSLFNSTIIIIIPSKK